MEESTVNTQSGENSNQQGAKNFTQDDVNRIVQERLARVKAEPSGKEADLEMREKDLNTRELKLKAKEIFSDKKLPAELMDILDYSDEVKMNRHIKILEKTYSARPIAEKPKATYTPACGSTARDPFRDAMGLNR